MNWDTISSTVAPHHLLVIDVHPAIEPTEDRARQDLLRTLSAMSAHVPVILLTCAAERRCEEHVFHAQRFCEIRFPGGDWLGPSLDDARTDFAGDIEAFALTLALEQSDCPFGLKVEQLAKTASHVIHRTVFTAPIALRTTRRESYFPAQPISVALTGGHGEAANRAFLKLLALEQALCSRANCIFAARDDMLALAHILHGAPAEKLLMFPLISDEIERAVPDDRVAAFLHALHATTARTSPEAPAALTLALNDYDVKEGTTGGMRRIVRTLGALERPVALLTLGAENMVTLTTPTLAVVTIAKTPEHKRFEELVDIGEPVTTGDIIASLFIAENAVFQALTAKLAPRADACILEHCYVTPLCEAVITANPDIPFIYSAHNVESVHRPLMLAEHSAGARLAPLVVALEREALDRASLVICCTKADAAMLSGPNKPALILLNGCDAEELADSGEAFFWDRASSPGEEERPQEEDRRVRVGFIGSDHRPNEEAAKFILAELAPAHPELEFEIIGGVCSRLAPTTVNVLLHGPVDEDEKARIMSRWTIALNPINSGGGSSLKLPDYLAHGLAVISTAQGARGFSADGAEIGLVVPRGQFSIELHRLATDAVARNELAERGRSYARARLDWDDVAIAFREKLESMVRSPVARHRKLLVVADAYPEGLAADEHCQLFPALDILRPYFESVDLLAIDAVVQKQHDDVGFSLTSGRRRPDIRVISSFDRMEFFPISEQAGGTDLFAENHALRATWIRTSRRGSERLADIGLPLHLPRLLGGIYDQERDGEIRFHWSSGTFSFLLPAGTVLLEIRGQSPRPKALSILLRKAGARTGRASGAEVEGDCHLCIAVPRHLQDSVIVCVMKLAEHVVPPDVRTFGLVLNDVVAWTASSGAVEARPAVLRDHGIDLTRPIYDQAVASPLWPEIAAWLKGSARREDAPFYDTALPRGMAATLRAVQSDYSTFLLAGTLVKGLALSLPPARQRDLIVYPGLGTSDPFLRAVAPGSGELEPLVEIIASDGSSEFSPKTALMPLARFAVTLQPGPTTAPDFVEQLPYILVLLANADRHDLALLRDVAKHCRQGVRPTGIRVVGDPSDLRWNDCEGLDHIGDARGFSDTALFGRAGAIVCLDRKHMQADILRGWSHMRPVIADGGHRVAMAMIDSGATGLLFADGCELILLLERLLNDEDHGRTIGRAGFRQGVEHYSQASVAKRFCAAVFHATSPKKQPLKSVPKVAAQVAEKKIEDMVGNRQ